MLYRPLLCPHPSTLLATSRLLPPPPSVRSVDSVAEWLEALQLSQLAGKFEGLTLQKISKMWDIELTSVSVQVCSCSRHLVCEDTIVSVTAGGGGGVARSPQTSAVWSVRVMQCPPRLGPAQPPSPQIQTETGEL